MLILASASPARAALLESVGITPDHIIPADIDEIPRTKELPAAFAKRMGEEKALAVSTHHPNAFIIAADTIAAAGRRIIGKAETEEEACKTLSLLSGRRHKVHTGLCIIAPSGKKLTRLVTTIVQFKRLHEKELETYLKSGQWQGKSGCYGIQSKAGGFIQSINGSFSNVVGLPLCETLNLLEGLGFHGA